MGWKASDPQGNESAKVRWELVQYTRGRGLDVGCGPHKAFPHMIGCDSGKDMHLFGIPMKPDVWITDAGKLEMFASRSMDFVYSSHTLEHIEPERVAEVLGEWWRVLKESGYLVLYLPDEDEYPKIGEEGANPDHKWDVNYDRVVQYMRGVGGWDLVDFQRRGEGLEYSLFFVFRKAAGTAKQTFSWDRPRPAKTAAVVRYGAFGDMLQASSVVAGLKKQGYHVTVFAAPPGHEAILHDPNVDAFYLQDKDQVPNQALSEFWAHHQPKFDRWVQLCESVEGQFLAMPGRAVHEWSPLARHKLMNHNYLEMAHDIAGLPHEPVVQFHATAEEKAWARKERAKIKGEKVMLWALAGSSVHKTWPYMDAAIASIMLHYPEWHVVLVGNEAGVILEQGWENEPRVHCTSGKWSIRQTLAFLEQVDCVIGPETGVLNAASHMPVPKVVFLSHSTDVNLTRDWENCIALASKDTTCPGRGQSDAPACHQMHYGWDHCKRTESGVAQCQADLTMEQAWPAIEHALAYRWQVRVA